MCSLRGVLKALWVLSASLLLVLAASTSLLASPERGRLSRDLVEALGRGDAASFAVIVQGERAAVESVAARYGARVQKLLRTGAVLEVSREALEGMSADDAIGHVAGDVPVRSMMAVTDASIGADQVWAGTIAGVTALTGRGSCSRSSGSSWYQGAPDSARP